MISNPFTSNRFFFRSSPLVVNIFGSAEPGPILNATCQIALVLPSQPHFGPILNSNNSTTIGSSANALYRRGSAFALLIL